MNRYDLYTTVHKGVRKGLFEAVLAVGGTDFAQAGEVAVALREVRRLLAFLEEHSEHEDAVILPELAALAPELHADLRAEHARIEGLQAEIERILARLEAADGAQRTALGRRLADRMAGLAAEHLRHMGREEIDANRVLWAHRSDADLKALEDRIVAGVPAERMGEWLALMLPAMNGAERRELLTGMAAEMPVAAFGVVTGPARELLGEAAWRDACPAVAS